MFYAITFQLCFTICHYEGSGKSGGTVIEWTHQLLAYAVDVNLLGDNVDTQKLLISSRHNADGRS
jgi:hypothetical protein